MSPFSLIFNLILDSVLKNRKRKQELLYESQRLKHWSNRIRESKLNKTSLVEKDNWGQRNRNE